MKKLAASSVLALSLLSLAGCPEKKPEGAGPKAGNAAASSAPTNPPAPTKPAGW